jgi:hypothetical protein
MLKVRGYQAGVILGEATRHSINPDTGIADLAPAYHSLSNLVANSFHLFMPARLAQKNPACAGLK